MTAVVIEVAAPSSYFQRSQRARGRTSTQTLYGTGLALPTHGRGGRGTKAAVRRYISRFIPGQVKSSSGATRPRGDHPDPISIIFSSPHHPYAGVVVVVVVVVVVIVVVVFKEDLCFVHAIYQCMCICTRMIA